MGHTPYAEAMRELIAQYRPHASGLTLLPGGRRPSARVLESRRRQTRLQLVR